MRMAMICDTNSRCAHMIHETLAFIPTTVDILEICVNSRLKLRHLLYFGLVLQLQLILVTTQVILF